MNHSDLSSKTRFRKSYILLFIIELKKLLVRTAQKAKINK